MNASTLLIASRPIDIVMNLRLRDALKKHGYHPKLETLANDRVIHGHRVEINNETLLYRLRDDYVSVTHYRTLNKSGLKNSFKSAFIFLSILAKALPEVKFLRADVEPQLHEAENPMSHARMLEFYTKKHGAVIYQRDNGKKWIEWSLSSIRDIDEAQPKYLQRIVAQYYAA